jgi:hypothetical protein
MRFIAEWCLNAANRLNERTAFLPRLLQHGGSSSFDGSRWSASGGSVAQRSVSP